MSRIAVLTSGGDAPGMNAALRSIVRYGRKQEFDVLGVRNGYNGLIEGQIEPLDAREVGGIVERAGTILGSSRCPEFKTDEGQRSAIQQLSDHDVDTLIVIGGSGSQQGSLALSERGVPVVGIASTIDNDLPGSDRCIGVDTALNVALESIDRLRATASSHQRGSIVEVMGRDHGYLALHAALAGGAEGVVLPEVGSGPGEIEDLFRYAEQTGKNHAMIIVAEGAEYNANRLKKYFQDRSPDEIGFQLRFTILGHVQRGGRPTAFDRSLGARLGAKAIDQIVKGETNRLVGWSGGSPTAVPLEIVRDDHTSLDTALIELVNVLGR